MMNNPLDAAKLTREELLAQLNLAWDLIDELKAKYEKTPVIEERISISKVVAEYINSMERRSKQSLRGLTNSSIYIYSKFLDRFNAFCLSKYGEDIPWKSMPQACQEFIGLRSGLQNTTLNNNVAILRTFLLYVADEYVLSQPHLPKFFRTKALLPRALNDRQVIHLLERAKHTRNGVRTFCLVSLVLATGIRRNELRFIQRRDIDTTSGVITITHPKGQDCQRYVSFPRELLPMLDNYLTIAGVQESDYVFGRVGNLKEPVSNASLDQLVTRLMSSIPGYEQGHPIYGYCFHSLRHTFAVSMLLAGTNLRAIQEQLGHSSMTTTQKYLRLTATQLRELCQPGLQAISTVILGRQRG